MRLIQCHIENFGKLHDLTFHFEQGKNDFCYENGWGKSTFAAFLRVMFYGFEGENKRGILEKERKRYEPWQGGTYGGSLTFEAGEKCYTMTRIFKDKTANDVFELRDAQTNLESNDFSANIGEELFQINSESFQRTIFISQNDCVTSTTDSINAKIGNLTDNTNDLNCFETADGALKDVLNKMNPKKKIGTLHQLQEEITGLKTRIANESSIESSIRETEKLHAQQLEQLEDIRKKKEELVCAQRQVSKMQDVLAKKEAYHQLCRDMEDKTESLQEITGRFPGEIPEEDRIRRMLETCQELEQEQSIVRYNRLTEEEGRSLQELETIFREGVPSDAEIETVTEKNRKLLSLRREGAGLALTEEETEQLQKDREYFGGEKQPTGEINRLIQQWNERNTIKNSITMQQTTLAALEAAFAATEAAMRKEQAAKAEAKGKEKRSKTVQLMLGLFLLAAGVAACVINALAKAMPPIGGQILTVSGLLLLAAGLGLCIAGLLGMVNKSNSTREAEASLPVDFKDTNGRQEILQLTQQIKDSANRVDAIEQEIEKYLKERRMSYEEGTAYDSLQKCLTRGIAYENLLSREEKALTDRSSLQCEVLGKEIEDFLHPFYRQKVEEEEYSEAISGLKTNKDKYETLKLRQSKVEKAENGRNQKEFQVLSFLESLNRKPAEDHLLSHQLQQILEDVFTYRHAKESYESALEKKEAFEQETNIRSLLESIPEEGLPGLDELRQQYELVESEGETVTRLMKQYEEQIAQLGEQYDDWNTAKEKLSEKEEELSAKMKQYERLEKTRELLTKAKESLTARYMEPILNSFSRYYEIVAQKEATDYKIDANTRVTVKEEGLQRDTQLLSTGYQDLIGLCLRLSLVDAMYQGEKPMLILDDPFVNLDEIKTQGGKSLLEELSKEYQVLYFTCRKERA